MVLAIVGIGFIVLGVVLSVLGVIGILRFPDTYTRLHASGKTSTLGVVFICIGTGFIIPTASLKLFALVIFLVFTGPVGSHAIAAAVHRRTAIHNEEAIARAEVPTDISGIHRIDEIRQQNK